MKLNAETVPNGAVTGAAASEPPLVAVVLIFWSAFAATLVFTRIMNPEFFEAQDPDSFLRLVQVRDLLAGQGWFDLVQHRMDPPGGALLQWSRLIDAPIAALVLLGNVVGYGELLALTAWPILLLLGLMGAAVAVASSLAGRAAAVWTLILTLFFLDPLLLYLPGDIDHHNAQIVVMLATVAFALRLGTGPLFGFLTGLGSSLTLAIGLEMLPHVAALGAAIAVRWAWKGDDSRSVAAFGATMAVLPAALFVLTGSPAVSMACDSLSWVFAVPALIAGGGLAALSILAGRRWERPRRIVGLGFVAAVSAGYFLGVTPECIAGPYGQLSPEVRTAFLQTVSEAQPIWVYGAREPIGAIGSLGPLIVALIVALRHIQRSSAGIGRDWTFPTVLLALAVALSFYQVRTLPFASALAIPVLGAWLADLRERVPSGRADRLWRALPVAAGFVAAIPFTYLLIGWGGVEAVSAVTGGRIAPIVQPKPDAALTKGLSEAEQNCFDSASGALLAGAPRGLVLAPLFYGSTVLKLSGHDVVAGPYHRNGQAILDAINATHRPPAEAKAIIDARGVDYVAICPPSQESAIAAHKGPDGLLAELAAGRIPSWLDPVPAPDRTALRLWRVVR